MEERGLVSREEIESGRVILPRRTDVRVLAPENVAAVLRKGGPTERDTATKPLFAIGDRVRAKNIQREGHTRLPRYVRGHIGVIDRLHGAHVFPDSNAHGEGEHPQWLYTVRFTGRELWGDRADATSTVSVDAWESYLERAE